MNLTLPAGITTGIPFADYLKLPGMSASVLKKMVRSPLAYRWALDHQDHSSTPAQALGTAAHTAILEPHRLKTDFAIYEGERRGKAWTEFKESNAGRQILTAAEFADVEGMRDSVLGFSAATRYLREGLAEVTMQWKDPASERDMRGRLDWLTMEEGPVIVDLKTTRDSSPRKFAADAFRLGYHIQFALYSDGYFYLTGETPRFKVIAVESKPPYEPAVFDVTEDLLVWGHDEYQGLLATLQACESTGYWPVHATREQTLDLPAWATGTNDEDDDDLSGLDLYA